VVYVVRLLFRFSLSFLSFGSTGTPSEYVHAAEWLHGDLGKVWDEGDCLLRFICLPLGLVLLASSVSQCCPSS
jgi:hypothetical protein